MTVHKLKTHPGPFKYILLRIKEFEYRRNDRDFQNGDTLYLEEWDPETQEYTGREAVRRVKYSLRGPDYGVPEGYIVMSIE